MVIKVEKKKPFRDGLKDFLMMNAGLCLMVIGIYFFKIPNGFSTGGVSGIATVLAKVLPHVTPGRLIFILNLALLLLGFIVLGRGTGVSTVWCSLVYSGLAWVLELIIPLTSPLTDQPFLELVIGILLSAVGSAFIFNAGASSGGTDIIALILKKYTSLDVGKALLVTDFLIALSTTFAFGLATGLYSLLGLFAKAFLIDGVIESLNQCKSFMIITDDAAPIVDYIINEMNHSATTFDAVGEYEGKGKKVIITLCRRLEAAKLKRKVKEISKDSFVIVTSTSEIIGRGFRSV